MKDKFMNRIKKLRNEKGYTQEKLGRILGITKTGVSYWESGQSVPNDEMLTKIADLFNVSIDYLLGRSDTPNPNDDNDIQLDDFQFALYGEVKDLTEEQKQTLLNMAKFLKDSNNGK